MMKSFVKQTNLLLLLLPLSLISSITITLLPSLSTSSLDSLHVNGHFTFQGNEFAATDFGRQFHSLPSAVLHPNSVSDISATLTHVWQMGPTTGLTVAARGHGHSVHGQSQTVNGIVINMGSLRGKEPMLVIKESTAPYVEVWAGELWVDVLKECLKHGLAPKSWTDYLYLTVGGTLSNAGISGQAFRHGPQINNVHQLEVVTGKGEVVVCSEGKNSDLFYGVLGGLGQFGIITRARISLEPAPKMVKWIRVVYSDFSTFVRDQERLISLENTFDYIEGLVIVNRTDLMSNWRSSFDAEDPEQARKFVSDGKILFCLEMAKNFNPGEEGKVDEEIKSLLSELSYIPSTMFVTEVSYEGFLDRVHAAEVKLRPKGLWDVPHPWLNLLVPGSKIRSFAEGVFGHILRDTNNGPVLVYPVDKSKWDNRSSFVTPEEDVFYLVAFLPHAADDEMLRDLVSLNERILRFCESGRLGVKQYLPHYTTEEEWRAHFGPRWESFRRLKSEYDPLAILAPGQRIFQKPVSVL